MSFLVPKPSGAVGAVNSGQIKQRGGGRNKSNDDTLSGHNPKSQVKATLDEGNRRRRKIIKWTIACIILVLIVVIIVLANCKFVQPIF